MNLLATLDTLGEATKAITKRRVQFGTTYTGSMGGLPSFGLNGWGNSYTIGGSPGAAVDYSTMTGDPLQNRVVAACINAKATALATAPTILEQKDGDDWKPVDHPVVDLLNTPNKYKSGFELWDATCAAEDTQGQVFWRLEFDRSGVPGEIWVDHPDRYTVLGTAEEYISGYRYQTEASGVIELEDREVIHIRRFANLRNGRIGWTPLSAGARQVHGDNAAATYHTAILSNSGVMSLLISIKEGLQNDQGMTPEKMQTFVNAVKHKLFGEGAGGIIGMNLPLDVKNMSFTPDELMVDKLISYYEATICALIGVDPMVIGLGSGTQQKTYANMGEALNDFWMRTIKPTATRYNTILNTQLLPLFGLDPAEFRLNRDYSDIEPMQENVNERHERWREDYKAGAFDLFQYQTYLGLDPGDELKGVMYTPPAKSGGAPGEPEPGEPPADEKPKLQLVGGAKKSWDAVKMVDSDELETVFSVKSWEAKAYDPRQPRDQLGKWSTSSGGISVGHAIHVMKAEGITDEKHHAAVKEAIESGKHTTREQVLAHIDKIHGMNGTEPPAEPTHQDKLVAAGDGSITPAQRSYIQQVHDEFHEVDGPGKQSTIIKANTAASLFGGKDSRMLEELVPEYRKMSGARPEEGQSQRVQYLADLHDELVKKYVGGPLSSAQIDNLGKGQASELIDMYKQGGLRKAMTAAQSHDSYAEQGIVGAGSQFGRDEKVRKVVRDFTEAWVKKNPLPEKKSTGAGS